MLIWWVYFSWELVVVTWAVFSPLSRPSIAVPAHSSGWHLSHRLWVSGWWVISWLDMNTHAVMNTPPLEAPPGADFPCRWQRLLFSTSNRPWLAWSHSPANWGRPWIGYHLPDQLSLVHFPLLTILFMNSYYCCDLSWDQYSFGKQRGGATLVYYHGDMVFMIEGRLPGAPLILIWLQHV